MKWSRKRTMRQRSEWLCLRVTLGTEETLEHAETDDGVGKEGQRRWQSVVDIPGTQRKQEPGVSLNPPHPCKPLDRGRAEQRTGTVAGDRACPGCPGSPGVCPSRAQWAFPGRVVLREGASGPMGTLGHRRRRPESESSTLRGNMSRNTS
jgi:hypothetical protein